MARRPDAGAIVRHELRSFRTLVKISILEAFGSRPNPTADDVVKALDTTALHAARDVVVRQVDRLEAEVEALKRRNSQLEHFIECHSQRTQQELEDRETAAHAAAVAADLPLHGFFVYVLWGDSGNILYVGRSTNILARLGSHMAGEKRSQVTRITVTEYPTYAKMCEAEDALIARHQPPLNVAGIRRTA